MANLKVKVDLKEMHFTKLQIDLGRTIKQKGYEFNISPTYSLERQSMDEILCFINLKMTSANNTLNLEVSLLTKVGIDGKDNLDDEMIGNFICNLVWPHIRGEISILTTQVGLPPMLLSLQPPVFKLIKTEATEEYVV